MKGRTIVWLGLAALLAVVLAQWLLSSRAPQQDVGLQGLLFATLKDRLNDVQQVRVVGAGGATLATLTRGEGGWALVERDGYPADAAKLRSLLLALAAARRVEAKTSNPALHERLAVEDISVATAKGVMLEISGGGDPLKVIVGENNARGKGTYVRIDGEPVSWLVDTNIAVERRPVEWLQRELVNLTPSRIVAVEVLPPDGEPIRIARETGAAGDFKLQNVPRGREPLSEFVADATAGLLDSLRFDDVAAIDAVPAPASGTRRARFESSEGLRVTLQSWKVDDKTYAQLSADLDEAVASSWAERVAADTDAASAASSASADAEPESVSDDDVPTSTTVVTVAGAPDGPEALRAELAQLQQRFAGRVFVLPAFKAGNLNRDLDAYLKPKE